MGLGVRYQRANLSPPSSEAKKVKERMSVAFS